MKFVAFTVIISLFLGAYAARDTFMINGTDVDEAVPFYVYLEIFRLPDHEGTKYFGGGTLITEYSVLTVAQNVDGFVSWRAGLGSHSIKQLKWYTVTSHVIHERYNASDLANNIAILNLAEPISPYSDVMRPIMLAPHGAQIPNGGSVGHIVGFGFGIDERQPEQLQYAQMTVLSTEECGAAYPHLIRNGQLDHYFCASNVTTGINICGGDQGGPMYSPTMLLLFGIQSFNRVDDCAAPESGPAAFIMVSRYGQWINQNFKRLN